MLTLVLVVHAALAAALLNPPPNPCSLGLTGVLVDSILPIQNCMYMYELYQNTLRPPQTYRNILRPQYLAVKVCFSYF